MGNKVRALTVTLIATCAVTMVLSAAQSPAAGQPPAGGQAGAGGGGRGGPAVPGLALTSTAWADGGIIPVKHAGAGQSVSPALSWTNAPMGTVEYALIMNDPEPVRPAGSATADILHWLVVKIPGSATSIPEGAGTNSALFPQRAKQVQAYRGPGAPAAGPPHHYTLTLYALNAPLVLAENAARADVMAALEGKVLARGIFVGRYQAPAQP